MKKNDGDEQRSTARAKHGRDRVDLGRDRAADLAEHVGRQRVLPAGLDEFGDDDVVERDDEGQHEAGQDAGPEQRQRDAAEGLPRRRRRDRRRRVSSVRSMLFQPRPDRQIGEGDAEGGVRGDQVAEAGIAGRRS